MAIVISTTAPEYWEGRALEMVREAREAMDLRDDECKEVYVDRMRKAISLLGLALAVETE